jgi:hypothetical protein
MSRLDAEKLARLYDGFYSTEPLPKVVREWHLHEDRADLARDHCHTSPLEFVAGCAVLALVAFVFGVIL